MHNVFECICAVRNSQTMTIYTEIHFGLNGMELQSSAAGAHIFIWWLSKLKIHQTKAILRNHVKYNMLIEGETMKRLRWWIVWSWSNYKIKIISWEIEGRQMFDLENGKMSLAIHIWGDIKNRSLLLFCWGFTMRSKGNFRKSWYYSITRTDFVWVDVNKSCRNAMYLHPFNALNAKFIHQHQIEYQPVPSTIVSHVKLLSVDRMQKTQSITSHHHQQQHQDHIKTSPDVLNL